MVAVPATATRSDPGAAAAWLTGGGKTADAYYESIAPARLLTMQSALAAVRALLFQGGAGDDREDQLRVVEREEAGRRQRRNLGAQPGERGAGRLE